MLEELVKLNALERLKRHLKHNKNQFALHERRVNIPCESDIFLGKAENAEGDLVVYRAEWL
jgi:hypothetical protein